MKVKQHLTFYLYTLAVSPSLSGSRQHNDTTKTMGVLLRLTLLQQNSLLTSELS